MIEREGHVWSYDFVMDQTEDGRISKMMPVVDEYTRECLRTEVERSITAEDVVSTSASLFRERGEPAFIRSEMALARFHVPLAFELRLLLPF